MLVLSIDDQLTSKLQQRAASAKMSVEAYTQELLSQAIEEEDDLDLALEERQRDGQDLSTGEVRGS